MKYPLSSILQEERKDMTIRECYEKTGSDYENILKTAVLNSDAVIIASDSLSPSLTKFIESSNKPFLPFTPKDGFAEAYTNFYSNEVI